MSEKSWTQKSALLQPKQLLLITASAVMFFLGFAGFGYWPISFVALLPVLHVFDNKETALSNRVWFLRAWLFGYVCEFGGFYWLVNTLMDFSGFPVIVCIGIASIFFAYQGLQFAGVLLVFRWLRQRELWAVPALLLPFMASEWAFPMLFEHYYGNTLHAVPVLAQVAELGGPILCSALVVIVNAALYEFISLRSLKQRRVQISLTAAATYAAFVMTFGYLRIRSEQVRIANAPTINVGIVQANMSFDGKWHDPDDGRLRHVRQSDALEAQVHHPDLIVWPESALAYLLPSGLRDVSGVLEGTNGVHLDTPILFGGLREGSQQPRQIYNSAFLTDARGVLRGTYDKTYLLAFGEYLPFGETFPILYDWSPNSGHWSSGTSMAALPFSHNGRTFRIGTLICYEDIVSSFVRHAVVHANPHVLINITNDTWFGNTQEPWVHLALAKFRAIEHRRFLVRATNSGVSAVIDSLGRNVVKSQVFEAENIQADVAMLADYTSLYARLGHWPGYFSAFILLVVGWRRRRAN